MNPLLMLSSGLSALFSAPTLNPQQQRHRVTGNSKAGRQIAAAHSVRGAETTKYTRWPSLETMSDQTAWNRQVDANKLHKRAAKLRRMPEHPPELRRANRRRGARNWRFTIPHAKDTQTRNQGCPGKLCPSRRRPLVMKPHYREVHKDLYRQYPWLPPELQHRIEPLIMIRSSRRRVVRNDVYAL